MSLSLYNDKRILTSHKVISFKFSHCYLIGFSLIRFRAVRKIVSVVYWYLRFSNTVRSVSYLSLILQYTLGTLSGCRSEVRVTYTRGRTLDLFMMIS
jgi:hypothetical protein